MMSGRLILGHYLLAIDWAMSGGESISVLDAFRVVPANARRGGVCPAETPVRFP
jgi:hypothetical protein